MSDYEAASTIMNSGIDMFMLPAYRGLKGVIQYIDNIKISLKNSTVALSRLDDAVTRILAVKMSMGLLQPINRTAGLPLTPNNSPASPPESHPTSSGNEYQDALQAVHESVVLLKNENKMLPVKGLKTGAIQYVVLIGERVINVNHLSKNFLFRSFDNIGMQCGGWTLRWQGF
jgi:beta-glucosidase